MLYMYNIGEMLSIISLKIIIATKLFDKLATTVKQCQLSLVTGALVIIMNIININSHATNLICGYN